MPGGIRTPNLLIRSQLLYPVELQTQLPGGDIQSHGTHENVQALAHSRHSGYAACHERVAFWEQRAAEKTGEGLTCGQRALKEQPENDGKPERLPERSPRRFGGGA